MHINNQFKALYDVIKREVYRISDSWVLLFSNLIAPMGAFFIIYWIFASGVIRDQSVCIVDQDQSSTSQKISMLIDASSAARVAVKTPDIYEARALMDQGLVDGIIVIPADLEHGLLKSEKHPITIYINNMNVVKGGILYSGLYKTIATISGGIQLGVFTKSGMSTASAMAQIQPVRMDTHLLFNPFGNYAYFLATGLLPILAIIFIFLGTLYALGSELRFGTAPELMEIAQHKPHIVIIGKLFPYTLIYMLHMLVINIILISFMGIPVQGSLFLLLLSEVLLIIAYQLLAIFLLNITGNLRFSLSLGSAYTMMALTFSGLTFPTMGMPLIAKLFSYIFPYTFWLKIFLSQSLRGAPVQTTLINFGILLIFVFIGIISIKGLIRKFMNPDCYGRK